MAVILGIDAAWTERGSSAVAVLRYKKQRRHIVAVAPSYSSFIELGHGRPVTWASGPGGAADVTGLLATAELLAGSPVDVVAIDMPMSRNPIRGYRIADRELSRAFGAVQVSTHTPNGIRPGSYGRRITAEFIRAGFCLATATSRKLPSLVEVFPLAALVQLMGLSKRPAYKSAKTSRYWPGLPVSERLAHLLESWEAIESALRIELVDLGFKRPTEYSTFASLKPFEDALDAVICAWAGACFLEGRAKPFGDHEAAIWVPDAQPNGRSLMRTGKTGLSRVGER